MTDPARSEETVFLAAMQMVTAQERIAYVRRTCADDQELCGRVLALLVSHDASRGPLDLPPPGLGNPAALELPLLECPGTQIGPYTLLEQIGEGGMGIVFVAVQAPPIQRKVALKIIKPGMDTREVVTRFEAERQVLALMNHPNIAQVFDGGTNAAGRPFFVMELVEGTPITEFCDQHQLTTRERLELFVTLCQAVQYAHQKGVIHRDLKPSNLLVEVHDVRPVPKIIDFGIAKAVGRQLVGRQLTDQSLHTGVSQLVGTPLYMSPEQVGPSSKDIDTRSDIYSLGVVLYELLTGRTPFESQSLRTAGVDEMRRIIREVDPPSPSTRVSTLQAADLSTICDRRHIEPHKLSQQLRGELDWIVMQALEKDRDRRYQSASALAEDVERYLRDEPVVAGPPSTAYRLRKFVRRNKRALITASAAALATLVGVGALGGSIGYIVREHAIRVSETERAVETALNEANTLEQQAKWSAALEAVKRAQVAADSQGGSETLRATVRQRIHDLMMVLRVEEIRLETSAIKDETFDWSLGDRLYTQAFRDYGIDVDALSPEDVAQRMPDGAVRSALAAALDDWARLRRAATNADKDAQDKDGWKRLVAAARATDLDPARSRLREAWMNNDRKIAHELVASVPRENLLPSQVLLTEPLLARDEYIALLRDAQFRHPADFWLNHTLGLTLITKEPLDASEALGFYRAALALRPESPGALFNLATALSQLDRYDEAIAVYEQAIQIKPDYATAYASLAAEYVRQGALDKAVIAFRHSIALHPDNAAIQYNLGTTLVKQGIWDNEAETALREAIRLKPQFAQAHCNLGVVLARRGDLDGAEEAHRKAVWLDPNDAEVCNGLGGFLCDSRHDYDGAITEFRRAIELGLTDGRAHCNLGIALVGKGQVDEAIEYFHQAIQIDPDDYHTHLNLCRVLMQKQSWDEAMAAAREVIRCEPEQAEAHCQLGRALQAQGQLREALESLQRGHALGVKDPNWPHPSARWIEECQQQLDKSQSEPKEAPPSGFLPPLPGLWRGEGGVRGSLVVDWAGLWSPRCGYRELFVQFVSCSTVSQGATVSKKENPVRSKAPTTVLTGPDISSAAWSARSGRWPLFSHYSQTDPSQKEHTMSRTHQSRTASRRDLANSKRSPRSNANLRLCRRPLRLEHLEERQLLATITGQAFNDLNANGLKEPSESGQSGWTIYLDADGNGQLDTGETSTTTVADGSYSLNGLAEGTYNVAEVQQPGWSQTSPVGSVPTIERVSVDVDGTQGDDISARSSISADGRYVAFHSRASNLVPGDTNGVADIFVYDRQMDTIERVSIASDGTEGNASVLYSPSLSADGRYVAFNSYANNLIPGLDSNGGAYIFIYDRQLDTIERISQITYGSYGNDSASPGTSISADGRYVVFPSDVGNLVPGDTNGTFDIFVYDRELETIERVSTAADGTQANTIAWEPSMSADGRNVAFTSNASNLVSGDTNGKADIFVVDLQLNTIERVSLAADGTQGNSSSQGPSISPDGRFVTYSSDASNLVSGDTNGVKDVFVWDRQLDTIERVSLAADGTQGNGVSLSPALSTDGLYVTFVSDASNLVPGDTNGQYDVFLYDRQTDAIKRVNLSADGEQGNSSASYVTFSADGRYVTFSSQASNLIPGDTNGVLDVFVTANPFAWAPGSHSVTLAEGQTVSGIDFGNAAPTKFYVVNDATQNLTYEYTAGGQLNESYSLNTGNLTPRGAASTIAGDKTWVVDANRKVYVYDNSGGLLGSWTAGTLASNATVEGIATNGADVWIVDAKSDKVFKYTGAATRTSGTQYAASSFRLNSSNTSPKDIVTDGTSLWVINDSTTDKVFKYAVSGTLAGSWTISAGGGSPTGITLNPGNVSHLWTVDSATDRVYQFNAAANVISGSLAPSVSFALAAGNTNPQGIADPPAPSNLLTTETPALATTVSTETDSRGTDAALGGPYYVPLKRLRIDTAAQRSESRKLESPTRDLNYTVGASASRIADDSRMVRDNHRQTEVDDLFAQWESDPLRLLSLPDLGM